jgi:TatD DNase family protein
VAIDSHCHLADEVFEQDLIDVVARARQAGVGTALCILSADEPEEVARAGSVRAAWPTISFAAAVHPHRAGAFAGRPQEAAAATRGAAAEASAVALGEMGLDYHYDFAPRDVQRDVFAAQTALARELSLPVIIHTREAAEDTLDVLRSGGAGPVRGVMHCFTGTVDEARRALDLGLHISLSGIVTFPKSESLRDVARFVPADRLLVETDAPFLAPVPYRGRRNEPAWVVETLRSIAATRRDDAGALADQIASNFNELFGPRAAA